MKKLTWIVVLILIVAALIMVRMKRAHERNLAPLVKVVPPAVDTATVIQGKVVHTRHVLGTVVGEDEADVAPRVMAQVLKVTVREGAAVRKGQLLVQLDPRELEDAVDSARAGVEAAREGLAAAKTAYHAQHATTARDRKLFDAKAIAQEQWDNSLAADAAAAAGLEAAKAQVEVAEKHLDQAKTRLSYCAITAPFSGLISRRLADPGDLGVPGKPLLKMVHQQKVRVRAEVPPEDYPSLHVGQPVTLTLNDLTLEAKVSRVFPALGASHLAALEADLASPPAGFVSGATVGVDVHLSSAQGLSVPADALLEGEKGAAVFKVVNGTVHTVHVQIQDRSSDTVVVTGDLAEGDRVIVARPSRLMTFADGMKVQVADQKSVNK